MDSHTTEAWERALNIIDDDGTALEPEIYFDGFILRVFSSLYTDWGLEILRVTGTPAQPVCTSVFYDPACLSVDSYGFSAREDLEWEEAEQLAAEGVEGAFVEWDYNEWRDALRGEAWDLLTAYTDDE